MPYGTLALDTISTSGNLAITGNTAVTGNLTVSGNAAVTGNLTVTGTIAGLGSGNYKLECAQLASTVAYNIPDSGIAIVPFDTVLIDENITVNRTASTVNGIEAYHWQHSTTGVYRIRYDVRTTSDTWNMISVCRNNNTALPVGNSFRTGAPAGQMGTTFECLYRVSNVSDRFGLFHWCVQSTTDMSAHGVGNPASSFFVTPEAGTAPTTGYYSSIVITKC